MFANKINNLVLEAERVATDPEEFPGRRWLDEGGIEAYKKFAKDWITRAALFMRLDPKDVNSDSCFEFELCLVPYFDAVEVNEDTVRICNSNIQLRKDIMAEAAGDNWPKMRAFLKNNYPGCKRDLNRHDSTKTYRRYFEMPWSCIPSYLQSRLAEKGFMPVSQNADVPAGAHPDEGNAAPVEDAERNRLRFYK